MKDYIRSNLEKQVSSLRELIAIPSVSRGDPKKNAPLGAEVAKALSYTLNLARELGFEKVWDLDGLCGIVEYGEGEEYLGIMAHLDVVPAGDGWSHAPFGAEVEDGKIFGRGTVDDKGPAIAALYALAAIKNSGLKMKRRVRLILGCDEEVGWLCMERYNKTEKEPDLAFTPDAEYPAVNVEMGIYQGVYSMPMLHFGAECDIGTAANVIPGKASITLENEPHPVPMPEGLQLCIEGNTLTVMGKGGHASMPDLANNALAGLIFAVNAQDNLNELDREIFSQLSRLFGFGVHGEGLGVDVTDQSGRTTLVPTKLSIDSEGVMVTLDCRYPFSFSPEEIMGRIDEQFEELGYWRIEQKQERCHYIAEDSELVQTLMEIYNRNANVNLKPLKMGGGTYARAFKNAVAFGPVAHDGINLCHMPDEYISIEDLEFNTVIMAEAIQKLACEP